MLKIGIAGCGLQAATIASYIGVFGDNYQVCAVMDINIEGAKIRLAEKKVLLAEDCVFCQTIDEFRAAAQVKALDGIIIGTFCNSHTEVACALESLTIPLYMEKPVAINMEQIGKLYHTFKNSRTSVQVSLPMRLCPLTQEAEKIIRSSVLGDIYQVTGHEDTDGEVYFRTWFRDNEKTGGMFMQKAVHDIDYLLYLAQTTPEEVCAMRAKLFYRGDKPYDQTCADCPDVRKCQHGPLFRFDKRGLANSFAESMDYLSTIKTPDGTALKPRYCPLSKDIAIEDVGEVIIRSSSGAHICHTQNFIASRRATRRGARFVGGLGSLEIDFINSSLKVFSSVNGTISEYKIDNGKLSHYGGDRALIMNYINTMRTGKRSNTDLITSNGLMSTLACICARESADKKIFVRTKIPEK